jgi:hypothetical protein
MSRQFNAMGGSAADQASRSGKKIGLFHKGIDVLFPSSKKFIEGRILPSRDHTMNKADGDYLKSWIPYRDAALGVDSKTNQPVFTGFYNFLKMFTFFGNNGEHIVSPVSLRSFAMADGATISPEEWACPISDIHNGIKADIQQGRLSEEYEYLIKRPEGKPGPGTPRWKVPYPSTKGILNFWGHDGDGKYKSSILVVTQTAIENLQKILNAYQRAGVEPIDPDWPNYLYGDITNPDNGLMVSVVMKTTDTGNKFSGFQLSPNGDDSLDGLQKRQVPANVMESRHDLGSSDTIKILSYQELVDFLVMDRDIPVDIIKKYCGHMANIGGVESTGQTTPSAADNNMSATVKTTVVTSPSSAGKVEGPLDSKFWIVDDSGATAETGGEQVAELIKNGRSPNTIQLCDTTDTAAGWKTADVFGFQMVQDTPPPPPPPPPSNEQAPPPPPPSSSPTEQKQTNTGPASSTTNGTNTQPAAAPGADVDLSKLTPEEQEEYKALQAEAKDNTQEVDPAKMQRLAVLLRKTMA